MSCTGHWSLSAWPSINIIILLQQECCWQDNHKISAIRLSCSLLTFKSVINCALVMMLHLNVHLEYLRLCRSGSFTLELEAGVSEASSIDICLTAIVAYDFNICFRNMLHTNFWRGVLGTSPCWSVQCWRVLFFIIGSWLQCVFCCSGLSWTIISTAMLIWDLYQEKKLVLHFYEFGVGELTLCNAISSKGPQYQVTLPCESIMSLHILCLCVLRLQSWEFLYLCSKAN